MGKKSKEANINATNDVKDVSGCTNATVADVGNNAKTVVEDKKKKKRDNYKFNDYDAISSEGHVKVDEDILKGKYQKNRKKRKLEFSKEEAEIMLAEQMLAENSGELGGAYKEKRKKKNKKKYKVGGDILLDGAVAEPVNGNGYEEADGDCQKEDHKKKKRRKLTHEVSGNSIDKTYSDAEEKRKRSLQIIDELNLGKDSDLNAGRDGKKKTKQKRGKGESNTVSSSMKIRESENVGKDVGKVQKCSENEYITEKKIEEKNEKRIRKKNNHVKEQRTNINDVKGKRTSLHEKVGKGKSRKDYDEDVVEKVELKKREKRKKENKLGAGLQEIIHEESANEGNITKIRDYADSENNAYSVIGNSQESKVKNGNVGKKNKSKIIEKESEKPEREGKSKKVRFSNHVEVFSSDDASHRKVKTQEENLVRGKRFSREEDAILKEAVFNYIEAHDLGEEGLNMVLHCRSYPELKNCWKEIGAALPYRPSSAIYYRAHILFERDERRKWTVEEYELIRKYQEEHGNNWKSLADELHKHRFHVKDTWRRIKLRNMKRGHWSQEEYQTLFDLVNTDLRMKAFEEKKSKHGMLRDNICWSAISDKLSTRNNATCCRKWYLQLTSPMVAEGVWADADDYRLLDALFNLDACCIEDVKWDDLLEHRSGYLCRKRWDQMVLHIGHHGNKSFADQVETLARRYCPDLLEAREAWDSRPVEP